MLDDWKYPHWADIGGGVWLLMHDLEIVGEANALEGGGFKWNCKLSDNRDASATSIHHAKAECLASFWKEQWCKLAEEKDKTALREKSADEPAPRTVNFEEMCREHFNEPVLLDFEVGRLVGYGRDDCDSYLMVNHPNPARTVYHTCVGGYQWLDRLKGQHLVISRDGQRWDDFFRIDHSLELNGAPKVPEFIVKRL
jgi:hypothetical protein